MRYTVRKTIIYDPFWQDDAPLLPCLTVDETEPVFTGLLDANGDPIFRMPNPIGFGRDDEW